MMQINPLHGRVSWTSLLDEFHTHPKFDIAFNLSRSHWRHLIWSLDGTTPELRILHGQEMRVFEKLEQWLYHCRWTFLTKFVFYSCPGGLGVFCYCCALSGVHTPCRCTVSSRHMCHQSDVGLLIRAIGYFKKAGHILFIHLQT